MRKAIPTILALLIMLTLVACGGNQAANNTSSPEANTNLVSEPATEPSEEPASEPIPESGTRVDIPRLKGSICVPDGYYALGEDLPYTDEMLSRINVRKQNFEEGLPLLQGQTLIVPADEPYADSLHYYLKVKDKKYDDITLSELSLSDYDLIATTVVSSFKVDHYETVTGNGLRFFVFNANQGLGNVCRYATILNGHMIYVYVNTGDDVITKEQQALLESIALSIRHGL